MYFPESWLQFTGLTSSDIPNIDEVAYPAAALRYRALELTSPDQARVIILGQDPYHGEGEAHGLAFSVPQGVRIPPSLRNIFTEVSSDLNVPIPKNTDLTRWAVQGVLLLNTALTVAPDKPGSHSKCGWSIVTDAIIRSLGHSTIPRAFIFWGKHAQQKRAFVPEQCGHLIIESSHPSPFSAHKGFLGSKPFSRVNRWLDSQGMKSICWG